MRTVSLTIALICLCSCGKRGLNPFSQASHTLAGQVFVVQANRINVKLGGVKVSYVPAETWSEHRKWIAGSYARLRNLRAYQNTVREAGAWVDRAAVDLGEDPNSRVALRKMESLVDASLKAMSQNSNVLAVLRADALRADNERIFQGAGFQNSIDDQWALSAIYFDWIDRVQAASATTNAEGVFRLEVPTNARGYIFAWASRVIPGASDEHYFWMREVQGNENSEICLTSMDTLDRGKLAELLGLASLSKSSSMELVRRECSLPSLDWYEKCVGKVDRLQSIRRQIREKAVSIQQCEGEVKQILRGEAP